MGSYLLRRAASPDIVGVEAPRENRPTGGLSARWAAGHEAHGTGRAEAVQPGDWSGV